MRSFKKIGHFFAAAVAMLCLAMPLSAQAKTTQTLATANDAKIESGLPTTDTVAVIYTVYSVNLISGQSQDATEPITQPVILLHVQFYQLGKKAAQPVGMFQPADIRSYTDEPLLKPATYPLRI